MPGHGPRVRGGRGPFADARVGEHGERVSGKRKAAAHPGLVCPCSVAHCGEASEHVGQARSGAACVQERAALCTQMLC